MNALLPLLLPLAVSMAAPPADLPAESSASPPSQGADLVEVHLGASTPGVRLVFAPPVDSGPDAEPYVIEVRAPTWGGPALSAAPAPGLTDEPLGAAPDLLASPVLASSVPTAAYATQPIEPLLEVPASEMVFLRHASADDIEPIAELEPTQETPLNGSVQAELASPPPEPDKEAEPPPEWVAAAENFEKACEGGYAEACTALASGATFLS